MLAIRMQRTGRKGHAQFRMVVQDSRRTPSSGRVVATLGSYNPHTKVAAIDTEKAATYLKNGAQPSDRVAALLKKEGVALPSWVKDATKKERTTRNPEKLRRNQPAEETAVEEVVAEVEEVLEEALEADIAAETEAEEAEAAVEAAEEAPKA